MWAGHGCPTKSPSAMFPQVPVRYWGSAGPTQLWLPPTKSPQPHVPTGPVRYWEVSRSHTAIAAQSPSAECPPAAAEPSGTAIQEGSSQPKSGLCAHPECLWLWVPDDTSPGDTSAHYLCSSQLTDNQLSLAITLRAFGVKTAPAVARPARLYPSPSRR